jgi:ABC-2 type transport system permease protein
VNSLLPAQFVALLRREVLENRALFIAAPAVLALVLSVFALWAISMAPGEQLAAGVEYLSIMFDGLSPGEMAPMFLMPAIPFIMMLYACVLIYLLNALYQDRKDLSVYFWQSMPVSNLGTVLSKVVTVIAVVPAFYVAILFVVYLLAVTALSLLGLSYDVEVAGLGYMFMAAVVSLLLFYVSAFLAALWLLPTIGWLLLFSAFAKRTPVMWALGVFILLGLVEDLIFGTQFLGNWVESRSNFRQYIVLDFPMAMDRLFSYDMLFGLVVGAILITGAVYMRRFVD